MQGTGKENLERKQKTARENREKFRALSTEEKIALIKSRRGESKKELARLEDKDASKTK